MLLRAMLFSTTSTEQQVFECSKERREEICNFHAYLVSCIKNSGITADFFLLRISVLSTEGGNRNWRDCILSMNIKPQSQYRQQRAVTSLEFVLDNDLIFPFPWQEHGMCERFHFVYIVS